MSGDIGKILTKLHSVYLYPARYVWKIPQKVFKMMMKHGIQGKVFDPFGGSGTLAVEAYRSNIPSISWDLNPIIEILVDAKIKLLNGKIDFATLEVMFKKALATQKRYEPEGSIEEWYPKKVIGIIESLWGYFHQELATYNKKSKSFDVFNDKLWSLYAIISLYATRKLSFTDDSIYKYYRSKVKQKRIIELLTKYDPQNLAKHYIMRKINYLKRLTKELQIIRTRNDPEVKVKGFVDILDSSVTWPQDIVAIITSPPYMIAHEYIRSFKYDLLWLGLGLDEVRELRLKEIPYRDPPVAKIKSEKYKMLKEIIKERNSDLLKYYDCYFKSIIYAFEKMASSLINGGIIAFFVGDATLAGIKIPIHEVLYEHLSRNNFKLVHIDEDIIRRRRLFKRRKNANPNGIYLEHLVVMQKNT